MLALLTLHDFMDVVYMGQSYTSGSLGSCVGCGIRTSSLAIFVSDSISGSGATRLTDSIWSASSPGEIISLLIMPEMSLSVVYGCMVNVTWQKSRRIITPFLVQ